MDYTLFKYFLQAVLELLLGIGQTSSVDEIDFVGRGAPCPWWAPQLCSNRANEGHEISIPLLLPSLLPSSYCRPLLIDCRLWMLLRSSPCLKWNLAPKLAPLGCWWHHTADINGRKRQSTPSNLVGSFLGKFHFCISNVFCVLSRQNTLEMQAPNQIAGDRLHFSPIIICCMMASTPNILF